VAITMIDSPDIPSLSTKQGRSNDISPKSNVIGKLCSKRKKIRFTYLKKNNKTEEEKGGKRKTEENNNKYLLLT
jgi:hypothetical protein